MKRLLNVMFFVFIAGIVFGQGKAKYVFYFIGDGMGVNQVNGTEMYLAEQEGRIGTKSLRFTQFPVVSMATTFSATNSVTDSSAAGTALATGSKTYNGAIGLDDNKERLFSVAERAKQSGKKVGVSSSVSIDHATPAAFYAHQVQRNMYYEIALDIPKSGFDFFAGAGFLKPTTNFEKQEVPSIFPILESSGYTISKGLDEYNLKSSAAMKMIMIQKEGAISAMLPYAIDRKTGDMTLAQITESGIDFLTKDNNDGFFFMLEGGSIDWACHDNDAATTFKEIIDLDNAVNVAYEFYKKYPDQTLIVVTADHETGGLGLGTGKYELNLKALNHQKSSPGELSNKIKELRKAKDHKVSWDEVKQLLGAEMGFWRELSLTKEQEKKLRDCYKETFSSSWNAKMEKSMYTNSEPLAAKAKEILNEIAMVGWISRGHSAGYVPVYALGADSHLFIGKMDNTEIPKRIAIAGGYK